MSRSESGGERQFTPDYPNSLKTYGVLGLNYVVLAGIVYAGFVLVLAGFELVTGGSSIMSQAAYQRAFGAGVDGLLLLRDAGLFLLSNPVLALGLVLAGYAGHLATQVDSQPTTYLYDGRPRWQYLLATAAVCVVAAVLSAGPVALEFERSYIATSFLYAFAAVYTVHLLGYTILDDTLNHGLEFSPWMRAATDFFVRGTLLLIVFDAAFGILPRAGVLQVGLRLVPPLAAGLYLGYLAFVDESRTPLSLKTVESRGAKQKATAGGGTETTGGSGDAADDFEQFRPTPPPSQDFDDVAGMDALKRRLQREVISPLRNPEKYQEYDINTVNGILLHGPPGTGKTHLSKSLAGELDYNYIEVTPSEITSKYVGEGTDNVEALFATARANQPCVVFIDEFDAIAGSRDGDMTSSERQMVNQLLEELSAINESSSDIVVVAATNLIDEVDDAITRPGRFDTTVEVPKPDADARLAILQHHLDQRGIETTGIDWDAVETATKGYAASNMTLISENLARELIHGDRTVVDHELLMATIDETRGKGPTGASAQYLSPPPDETLASVAGMESVVEQLNEKIIRPLSEPEAFEEYGLSTVNGVLFYGPPGTGKTLLSRAVAGELGYNYIDVAPSDILSQYVGEASESISELFAVAQDNQPCVIFFDEVDAIAPSRDTNMNQSQRQMVNQLLQELEGIQGEDVVVFAATNRLDRVDDAVKRSKRFDERIEIPAPDADTRVAILRHHLADRPSDTAEIDWDSVAQKTEGYTGSDMELVADEAGRNALKRSRDHDGQVDITEPDVLTAVEATGPSVE
ncbi:MAG: ATP-binding protein [Haloferacaceae archaeon]